MAYHAPQTPADYEALAEGQTRDRFEPDTVRTSGDDTGEGMVSNHVGHAKSATGIISALRLRAEGSDQTEKQDASMTHDEAKSSPDATPRDFTKSPILIVEDTVELAEVIQATLENMGLQATYATHGKVGLEKIKAQNPALLLMDIGLPDITGWKMLDSIKEHYTGSNLPMPVIIVITAYGDPANRLIGKLQGIHSYLIKPFTPDEVETLVRMAMRGEAPPEPGISK